MKTKIEWADFTLNPFIGCKHGCSYCYAKKMNDRFHFVKDWNKPEQKNWLKNLEKIKKPSIIFMGSMTDLFGDWVFDGEIKFILDVCGRHKEHTFLFLTKNPARYHKFEFPENCWKGFTLDGISDVGDDAWESWINSPNPGKWFASIEPLTKEITMPGIASWIIVGGMTPKSIHKKIWVDNIVKHCKKWKVPLFLKNNLKYNTEIKQYPEALKKYTAQRGKEVTNEDGNR